MEHKLEITANNPDDYNRAHKTIMAMFSEDIISQVCSGKIDNEILTIQINKHREDTLKDLILPYPEEYDGNLRGNEFILQMIAEKHVDEPIYPPKKIIFKYVDGSDLNFIVFKKVKFT